MPSKIESHAYRIGRFALGGIFIYASLDKIADPVAFAAVVENYRILPKVFVNPFALILPWVEIFCGTTLLTGYLVKGSTLILDLLLMVFIFSLSVNMIRGVDISCGCFSNSLAATKHIIHYVVRDTTLLFLGIWIFYFQIKREKIVGMNTI